VTLNLGQNEPVEHEKAFVTLSGDDEFHLLAHQQTSSKMKRGKRSNQRQTTATEPDSMSQSKSTDGLKFSLEDAIFETGFLRSGSSGSVRVAIVPTTFSTTTERGVVVTKTATKMALKSLAPSRSNDFNFIRECQALEILKTVPGIVRSFGSLEWAFLDSYGTSDEGGNGDGRRLIFLEYAEKGDLMDLLLQQTSGLVPFEIASAFARQFFTIAEAYRARGVCHRCGCCSLSV
jgi:hypothetical protein